MTENSNLISTVNLYLRNSWYHSQMKEYIQKGEIGELAIIRICHMTPGLAPGEGHEYEGTWHSMIAECTMWTLPVGMPDAITGHGMRRE